MGMRERVLKLLTSTAAAVLATAVVGHMSIVSLEAQRGGGRQGGPANGQAAAPVDLTGYWVSLITEDWRFRMVTPAKGDYASVPLNPEGRRVADTWDPAKDRADGTMCRAYG